MYLILPFALWASLTLNLILLARWMSAKNDLSPRMDKNLAMITTVAFAFFGLVPVALAVASSGRYSATPSDLHINLAVGAFALGIFGTAALNKANLQDRPLARRYHLCQFPTPPTRIQAASLVLTGGLLIAWALVQLVPQLVALSVPLRWARTFDSEISEPDYWVGAARAALLMALLLLISRDQLRRTHTALKQGQVYRSPVAILAAAYLLAWFLAPQQGALGFYSAGLIHLTSGIALLIHGQLMLRRVDWDGTLEDCHETTQEKPPAPESDISSEHLPLETS